MCQDSRSGLRQQDAEPQPGSAERLPETGMPAASMAVELLDANSPVSDRVSASSEPQAGWQAEAEHALATDWLAEFDPDRRHDSNRECVAGHGLLGPGNAQPVPASASGVLPPLPAAFRSAQCAHSSDVIEGQ